MKRELKAIAVIINLCLVFCGCSPNPYEEGTERDGCYTENKKA